MSVNGLNFQVGATRTRLREPVYRCILTFLKLNREREEFTPNQGLHALDTMTTELKEKF